MFIVLLSAHSTIAVDWDPEIKKMYYDDQEAEVTRFYLVNLDHQCNQSLSVYLFERGDTRWYRIFRVVRKCIWTVNIIGSVTLSVNYNIF